MIKNQFCFFAYLLTFSYFIQCMQTYPGSLVSSYYTSSSTQIVDASQEKLVNFHFIDDVYTNSEIAGIKGLEFIAKIFDKDCKSAITDHEIKPKKIPNIENISFLLMTPQENVSVPVTKANSLWNHKIFNRHYDTIILATGWTTNLFTIDGALDALYNAYMCRGHVNFVAINFSNYLDTGYEWSSVNTKDVGKYVAIGLEKLTEAHYSTRKIHLIGHSLGAHVVGEAGRSFTHRTNKLLPRITGLDPAMPCFNKGTLLSGLQKGDAKFVDIIHTDPGLLAAKSPIGDADFYPNGPNPMQPGCRTIWCSHSRAWKYYAESVYPGNSYGFESVKCSSIDDLDNGLCPGQIYPMGWACPTHLKGILYLNTRSKPPFGLNSKKPSDIVCNGHKKCIIKY